MDTTAQPMPLASIVLDRTPLGVHREPVTMEVTALIRMADFSSLIDSSAGLGDSLVVWLRAHDLKYEGPKFNSSRIEKVLSPLTPNLVSRVIDLPTHLEFCFT